MERFIRYFSYLIWPVAIPAWIIERMLRRTRPGWTFTPYRATPYFLTLVILSTCGALFKDGIFKWIGVYLITAMEIVALWVSVSISIGRYNQIFEWLRRYAKRGQYYQYARTTFTPSTFYMAIVSYFYTIYFFGFFSYIIFTLAPTSFRGVTSVSTLFQLIDFVYYSVITITTLGYGDITPIAAYTKLLAVSEVLCGVFFVIFLFGAYTSFYINKLSKEVQK